MTDCIDGKILLGKRKDSGLYGLPGGWLEKYEQWEDCAKRELEEETGLCFNKNRFRFMEALNCKRLNDNYHAISIIMQSEIEETEKGQIMNLEPHKCDKWLWVTLSQMRKNLKFLFYPLQDFLNKYPKINSIDNLKNLIKTPHISYSKADSITKEKENFTNFSPDKSSDSTFEEEIHITKDDLYLQYAI